MATTIPDPLKAGHDVRLDFDAIETDPTVEG